MPALLNPHLVARAAGGGDNTTVEIWTLFAVAVAATLLRMYSRISVVGFRGLRADDFLVWVGVVCFQLPNQYNGAYTFHRYSTPVSQP